MLPLHDLVLGRMARSFVSMPQFSLTRDEIQTMTIHSLVPSLTPCISFSLVVGCCGRILPAGVQILASHPKKSPIALRVLPGLRLFNPLVPVMLVHGTLVPSRAWAGVQGVFSAGDCTVSSLIEYRGDGSSLTGQVFLYL